MKKKIVFGILSIGAGILFTSFVLNKEKFYAKEEYLVFAFQVGAFENYDNAIEFTNKIPYSIIVNENGLYKVYSAIYKDIDILNKMLVYFEDNGINIYLKSLNVNKKFYTNLLNYEELIRNTNDINVYNKVNQSILNLYLESVQDEENN